jgi:hypothetical protein
VWRGVFSPEKGNFWGVGMIESGMSSEACLVFEERWRGADGCSVYDLFC